MSAAAGPTASASGVFAVLPGLAAPVGGLAGAFRRFWADSPAWELRATQLNLVLHLGANTTPADATTQFQTTVRFARRYPARVVVLCPDFDPAAPPEFHAKIHGECFFGKAKQDTRCVEFVLLHYTMAARRFLENQVSTCLASDLPLYYWAHRFARSRWLTDYRHLLTRSERVLFDGAVVPADSLAFPWPDRTALRDLAYTRTLPLRQTIGQFLARYAPAAIVGGLRSVTLRHRADLAAEATCLLGWVKKGLVRCGAGAGPEPGFVVAPENCSGCFSLRFDYADPARGLAWDADLATDRAEFSGDLGTGRTTLTAGAQLLPPEAALAEAMFG
jgi:hypothetical protein